MGSARSLGQGPSCDQVFVRGFRRRRGCGQLHVETRGFGDAVDAAILGPLGADPVSLADLPDPVGWGCVQGTGPENARTDYVSPGRYYVQLTTTAAEPSTGILVDFPAIGPTNDQYASAASITELPHFQQTELGEASLEPGETGQCAAGDVADRSAWYRLAIPQGRLTIAIGGMTEPVDAAIYGPFGSAPTRIADLGEPIGCVNDTGPDFAWGELLAAGLYFVQLTTTGDEPAPWIWIELMPAPQIDVRLALVAKGAAVDVMFDIVCDSCYDRDELGMFAYACAHILATGWAHPYSTVSVGGVVRRFAFGFAANDGDAGSRSSADVASTAD